MAEEFPNDPSILLLRGHIYCYGFGQYEFAQQQYELVLQITDEPEFVNLEAGIVLQAVTLGGAAGVSFSTPLTVQLQP